MNPGEKALSGPADVGEPSVELPQIPRIVFHSRILPIVPTGVKHIPIFRYSRFAAAMAVPPGPMLHRANGGQVAFAARMPNTEGLL